MYKPRLNKRYRRLRPFIPSLEGLEHRYLLTGDAGIDENNLFREVDLAENQDLRVTIFGAHAGDLSGRSVTDAGDVNGDGYDDIVIGAEGANGSGGAAKAGVSYLLFGSSDFRTAGDIDLANLGTRGIKLIGIESLDASGKTVASAGDVNGDGFDDFLIGAGRADGRDNRYSLSGETYLIFGRPDIGDADIELNNLEGMGVVLNGSGPGDHSGWLAADHAGDVNGDGLEDFIIGAPYASVPEKVFNVGESYLLLGRTSWPESIELGEDTGVITFEGATFFDKSGRNVSAAGDFNGDGINDFSIGAPNADPPTGGSIHGMVYIVLGKRDWSSTQRLKFGSLEDSTITIIGNDPYDDAGAAISDAGDINGDGFDDLVIGAYSSDSVNNERSIAGESYVVFGRAEHPEDGILDLRQNPPGITRFYGAATNDRQGRSVAGLGDINGDGFPDVAVASQTANALNDTRSVAGKTYLFYGGPHWPESDLDLAEANYSGMLVHGARSGDQSGRSVSRAGDLDGDGFQDWILGAFFADGPENTRSLAGDSYVFFGDDFLANVTHQGSPFEDSIEASLDPDLIVSGASNDTISHLATSDVCRTGQGNDEISIDQLDFLHVDAGNGIDTLRFPIEGTVDLRTIARKVNSIERIDLTSPHETLLKLDPQTLLGLSDESNELIVELSVNDRVDPGDDWTTIPPDDRDYLARRHGNAILLTTPEPGDANLDGIFNSTDLVTILVTGEFEDGIPNNSTFREGDWDGDGDFTTSDFIFALQAGNYLRAARPIERFAVAASTVHLQKEQTVSETETAPVKQCCLETALLSNVQQPPWYDSTIEQEEPPTTRVIRQPLNPLAVDELLIDV